MDGKNSGDEKGASCRWMSSNEFLKNVILGPKKRNKSGALNLKPAPHKLHDHQYYKCNQLSKCGQMTPVFALSIPPPVFALLSLFVSILSSTGTKREELASLSHLSDHQPCKFVLYHGTLPVHYGCCLNV